MRRRPAHRRGALASQQHQQDVGGLIRPDRSRTVPWARSRAVAKSPVAKAGGVHRRVVAHRVGTPETHVGGQRDPRAEVVTGFARHSAIASAMLVGVPSEPSRCATAMSGVDSGKAVSGADLDRGFAQQRAQPGRSAFAAPVRESRADRPPQTSSMSRCAERAGPSARNGRRHEEAPGTQLLTGWLLADGDRPSRPTIHRRVVVALASPASAGDRIGDDDAAAGGIIATQAARCSATVGCAARRR